MPLPKTELPLYTMVLPGSKKKITYRPFVTREVKILHQASEGGSEDEILQSIKQVANNCIMLPENIDVDKLPIIDLEYLFIKLRCRSVGEIIQARFQCQKPLPSGEICNNIVSIPVNLETLEVTMPKTNFSIVMIDKDYGIKMKYPTFEAMSKYNADDLEVIAESIESVFKGEEVYDTFTVPEAVEFLLGLKQETYNKVLEFFENQPEIKVDLAFQCKKCGFKDTVSINGLEELSDFFD